MKKVLLIIPLLLGCSQEKLDSCNTENYFASINENFNSGYINYQREIYTTLSEEEMDSVFNNTTISCKEILSQFFYCNICFNHDTNYLISYSGKRYEINNADDSNTFTSNLISLISSMRIGSEEYQVFLNSVKLN